MRVLRGHGADRRCLTLWLHLVRFARAGCSREGDEAEQDWWRENGSEFLDRETS
jgi:hypothetical protein